MTANPSSLVSTTSFSGLKYYLFIAILFLDGGIFLGGLNALRVAGVFNVPQIHQTHWTTTLFGSMTVVMMGLLLYLLSLTFEFTPLMKKLAATVLICIILGAVSSYISVWSPSSTLGRYFTVCIKLASSIYLFLVVYGTLKSKRTYSLLEEPAYIMIYAAIFWMGLAQLIFFGYKGLIGPYFMISYVYGYFSLTLFGVLSFVLPRMMNLKSRSKFSVIRDTMLISLSALFLLLGEEFNELNTILGLLGTISWGLVGFLFILYVFDIMFKTGISNTLIGLSIALVMFGFFVFDTLMRTVFPIWVTASHAHFMFLGTLVITIISLGILFLDTQDAISKLPIQFQKTVIFTVIGCVGLILLGFTLQLMTFSGFVGITLSCSLVIFELIVVIKFRYR